MAEPKSPLITLVPPASTSKDQIQSNPLYLKNNDNPNAISYGLE